MAKIATLKTNEKRLIVRSIRLTATINKYLEQIAAFEDRTVSKTIQRLLDKAVYDYYCLLVNNNQGFNDFLRSEKSRIYYESIEEEE